ncbi:MAG: type VII toxin-antitoxin system HepT family RNase toxin [Bacillota bacterium]
MPVDKLLVKQRLAYMEEYLTELKLLAEMPKEDFLTKRNAAAGESFLRRSLEAVFDIGRHILAKAGRPDLAMEYKSIARGLHEEGIIGRGLAEKLLKMAGYRNRLVHLYHQVSVEELYGIICNELADIQQFKDEITAYLRKC